VNGLALFRIESQQRGGILDPCCLARAHECEYSALSSCRHQIIQKLRGVAVSECGTRIDIRLPINRYFHAPLFDRERIRSACNKDTFP